MTANSFKERYRNHKKSFTNATYMNETEMSKYIWKLKQNGRHFSLTWSLILRHAAPYSSGGKQCSLCTEENSTMYFKSKQETRTKFTIRNFLKVTTPEEILSGKLRRRVRLRSHAQNVKLCTCVSKPGVTSANTNELTFRS
jgi:hypothetical protein